MTIDCGSCGARYNIQDSLIPPQGARVKCKKCASMIAIPPPPVAELAPQDLELIPPASEAEAAPPAPEPEAPATMSQPGAMVTESYGSGFETVAEPNDSSPAAAESEAAPSSGAPSNDLGLERYPGDITTSTSTAPQADDDFERAGAPARFGSPPAFTDPSTPSGSSYGSTMTIEPITASSAAVEETESESTSSPSAGMEAEGAPAMAASPAPAAPTSDAPAPVAETTSLPTGSPLPSGLSPEEKSAHEKARRLARVLASDISIYNRDKKERGIREGNLVAMLGYEIKKSWEIYKERVGSEFANSTPYFRDALNEMLADGKKIF